MRKALRFYRLRRTQSDQLFNHFRALTDGIQELKLHRRRREMFISKVLQATATSYRGNMIRVKVGSQFILCWQCRLLGRPILFDAEE